MEQISIKAYTPSDPEQTGTLQIRRFSKQDIMINVLKKLGLFWGIALVTVLIPVFHFITVPLFFILGIFQALKAKKAQFEIQDGQVPCPRCQKIIAIKKSVFIEGHKEICQNCVTQVTLLV